MSQILSPIKLTHIGKTFPSIFGLHMLTTVVYFKAANGETYLYYADEEKRLPGMPYREQHTQFWQMIQDASSNKNTGWFMNLRKGKRTKTDGFYVEMGLGIKAMSEDEVKALKGQ